MINSQAAPLNMVLSYAYVFNSGLTDEETAKPSFPHCSMAFSTYPRNFGATSSRNFVFASAYVN